MTRYITSRAARAVFAVWIAATLTFFILRLLPGGPAQLMLEGVNDPALESKLLADYGLDRPLIVQYHLFMLQLVQGNLGTSFSSGAPVADILMSRLPWTLLLTGSAFILALVVGIPLGVYAAARKDGWQDKWLRYFGMAGQAMFAPGVGVLLLVVFGLNLGWFPVGGSGEDDGVLGILGHLVLPLASLTFIHLGPFALTVRMNMLQVLGLDYIRSAKSRGLTRHSIIWKHGLRNAIIPTVTLMGIQVGTLVGGAVLTETVFAYPGVGSLIFESVSRQDFPVLQGAFILLAVTVVLANLITDVVCVGLDPKRRMGNRA